MIKKHQTQFLYPIFFSAKVSIRNVRAHKKYTCTRAHVHTRAYARTHTRTHAHAMDIHWIQHFVGNVEEEFPRQPAVIQPALAFKLYVELSFQRGWGHRHDLSKCRLEELLPLHHHLAMLPSRHLAKLFPQVFGLELEVPFVLRNARVVDNVDSWVFVCGGARVVVDKVLPAFGVLPDLPRVWQWPVT